MTTEGTIIDIHCHTAGIGAGASGCLVSERLRRSWKYQVYLRAFGVTEEELLREGDSLVLRRLAESLQRSRRVSGAVVLALDGVVDKKGKLDEARTELYIPDGFVAAGILPYPNLLFGASVNPYRRDALDRLEWAAARGAVLLKWLPSVQLIDPADERLIPFYLRLRELGLPLLTHTGSENSFTRAHDEFGDPMRLCLPLAVGVTVIAAHAGAGGASEGEPNLLRLERLCREYPRIYADVSALTQVNRLGQLRRVLRQPELAGRLLYGSDMPLLNTRLVSPYPYLLRLPPRKLVAIARIRNPWDQDVALKEALGVRPEVFARTARLLREEEALKPRSSLTPSSPQPSP